jgi:hypothetical protein
MAHHVLTLLSAESLSNSNFPEAAYSRQTPPRHARSAGAHTARALAVVSPAGPVPYRAPSHGRTPAWAAWPCGVSLEVTPAPRDDAPYGGEGWPGSGRRRTSSHQTRRLGGVRTEVHDGAPPSPHAPHSYTGGTAAADGAPARRAPRRAPPPPAAPWGASRGHDRHSMRSAITACV